MPLPPPRNRRMRARPHEPAAPEREPGAAPRPDGVFVCAGLQNTPRASRFPPRTGRPVIGRRPQPADEQSRGEWWSCSGTLRSTPLKSRIGDANQDLKAAFARLQQARAATRIARADLFPTLGVGASAMRSRTSVNSPRFPAGADPTGNNFDLQADLSYEFDVWGRVRNALSSAKAGQQASAADLAALNLSIRAELAVDYFALRAEDTQQCCSIGRWDDYAKSLQLIQNLYDGGGRGVGGRRSGRGAVGDGAHTSRRHTAPAVSERTRDCGLAGRKSLGVPHRSPSAAAGSGTAPHRSGTAIGAAGAAPRCGRGPNAAWRPPMPR